MNQDLLRGYALNSDWDTLLWQALHRQRLQVGLKHWQIAYALTTSTETCHSLRKWITNGIWSDYFSE